MPKGLTFDNALLQLLFNNNASNAPVNAIGSGLQDSASAGSLYVSLHTADPTASGNQSSSEISYTGYARQPVARSSGGWTVTANSVFPASNIVFGAMTAGTGGTVTHWSVGTGASGTGYILYTGTVSPNIVVSIGVTPQLTTASTITES
jgi:hypothetical protein